MAHANIAQRALVSTHVPESPSMPAKVSFADARIVRLNANLMPVTPAEARLYKQLGVTPVEV